MADEYNKQEADSDSRDSVQYWRKWVKNAKKAAQSHFNSGHDAWGEFENKQEKVSTNFIQPLEQLRSTYPIYFSAVKTIEPSFYSRTPKLSIKRKFGITDSIALTASLIKERLGDHLVQEAGFDEIMMGAVGDYIHADKATTQLKYTADLESVATQVEVMAAGECYTDKDGAEIEEEIFQNPDGSYFYNGQEDRAVEESQKIELLTCSFDQILHTPDAETQKQITEKAYFFSLTKDQAEKRFPNLNMELVQWKTYKSDEDEEHNSRYAHIETNDLYLEGYECWCLETKKVYCYSDQYIDLLEVRDDYYKLKGFFPSPSFIIGSKPSKSLFPTPVFVQLYGQIKQLNSIAARLPNLIDSIRRRAIAAPGMEDLVTALNSLDDAEFVTSPELTRMVAEGGKLQDSIFFVPVQELVQSISELQALKETFKSEFYEFFGLPQVLRGQSDPLDGAETVRRQQSAGNDRFRYMKKQVRVLARDSIEMMCDLALYVYGDKKIANIVGLRYMNPQDQQRFSEALAMLRDDKERVIRLEIETDSMSFVDEALEMEKMEKVTAVVSRGMQEISGLLQVDPGLAEVSLKIMLMTLENIAPGRSIMDDIRQSINDLIEDAKEAKENPPEPQPDIEQMKLQMEQYKTDAKTQIEGAKLQRKDFENQLALQKQNADQFNEATKRQIEGYELQIEQTNEAIKRQQESYELQLKAYEVKLDEAKVSQEQQKINLENVVQNFMMQIEGLRVSIEQFKAEGAQAERMMEERRLAQQVENEGIIGMVNAIKETSAAQAPPPPALPPITIPVTIEAPKNGVKTQRVKWSSDNEATIEEVTEMPIPDVPMVSAPMGAVDPLGNVPIDPAAAAAALPPEEEGF